MSLADLPEVLRIEESSFASPWPRSQFVYEIRKNPLSRSFVLRDRKEQVRGFGICWIVGSELHIANLAIDPQYRRRGLGEVLLRHMIGLGEEKLCRMVKLEVRVSNDKAIALYKKVGFEIIETISDYYENNHEDAYALAKTMVPDGGRRG